MPHPCAPPPGQFGGPGPEYPPAVPPPPFTVPEPSGGPLGPPPPPPGYEPGPGPGGPGPGPWQPQDVAPPGGGLAPAGPSGPFPARNPVAEWLLCVFVPFYSLYWFYRANKDLQMWSGGRIDFNGTNSMLAITIGWFILVPPFVAWASFMGRIREAQGMAGLPQTANFWGSIGRGILLSYNIKWHQDQFNEISLRPPQY